MDTATVAVKVLPAAVITLGDSTTLYPGGSYQINSQGNCTGFMWYPATGLDNPYLSNPTATPPISTKYVVTATTPWGCIAMDSINIYVSDQSTFAMPNAFAPGSGPNGIFKVIVQGEATLNNFAIFDRWGVKVFETNDIAQGWDGTYNGKPQPQDVYIYQITAVSSSGQTFSKTGNVTLLR
jgi:gliding motility-associated-like protein